MTDKPVDLDDRRGMAAQVATEVRRERLHHFEEEQAGLRRLEDELERLLDAAPAQTWPEAGAKADLLIRLFAETQEAQDPRRRALIAHVLEDLARLRQRKETTA